MYGDWPVYVPVAKKRQIAEKKIAKLKKQGVKVSPVHIEGRKITTTFWGDAWCKNLESYSDYESRLPRGRTYVRNGSVIDLQIKAGEITAMVSGSEVYSIKIKITPISEKKWNTIKEQCAGKISSVVELLQGKLSDSVMELVTRKGEGLFPAPSEIDMKCNCLDWAGLCKHLAAVLYGVGARLDHEPEMLFKLRGIDSTELVDAAIEKSVPVTETTSSRVMDSSELSDVFGVDVDMSGMEANEKDDSDSSSDIEQSSNTAKPDRKSAKSGNETARSSKSSARKGAISKKSTSAKKTKSTAKVQQSSSSRKSVKSTVKSKASVEQATPKKAATAKAQKSAEKKEKSAESTGKSKTATSAKAVASQQSAVKSSQKSMKTNSGISATKKIVPSENERNAEVVSDAVKTYGTRNRISRTARARRRSTVRTRNTARRQRGTQ